MSFCLCNFWLKQVNNYRIFNDYVSGITVLKMILLIFLADILLASGLFLLLVLLVLLILVLLHRIGCILFILFMIFWHGVLVLWVLVLLCFITGKTQHARY